MALVKTVVRAFPCRASANCNCSRKQRSRVRQTTKAIMYHIHSFRKSNRKAIYRLVKMVVCRPQARQAWSNLSRSKRITSWTKRSRRRLEDLPTFLTIWKLVTWANIISEVHRALMLVQVRRARRPSWAVEAVKSSKLNQAWWVDESASKRVQQTRTMLTLRHSFLKRMKPPRDHKRDSCRITAQLKTVAPCILKEMTLAVCHVSLATALLMARPQLGSRLIQWQMTRQR